MAWDGVLVRYGEIGIKSPPVRREMERRLRDHLLWRIERDGLEGDVHRMGSRLWMVGPDVEALLDLAVHTFGVVSASPARLVDADLESMKATGAEVALRSDWDSFAVRASREGEHPYSSPDVGRIVGAAVWEAAEAAGRPVAVDLSHPDLELWVEVRQDRAYVYTEKRRGPGGLPMGSQGRVVALVDDPDSFLAAWLLMRRGCRVDLVHAGDTGMVPVEGLEALVRWGHRGDLELLPVCTGTVTKATLMEAAATVAEEHGAHALVTGEGIHADLIPDPPMPVLRPLCGLDPEEKARWRSFADLGDWPGSDRLDPDATESVERMLGLRRTVSA